MNAERILFIQIISGLQPHFPFKIILLTNYTILLVDDWNMIYKMWDL